MCFHKKLQTVAFNFGKENQLTNGELLLTFNIFSFVSH